MKVRCMESPMSSVSFNSDLSCIAVASATGFGIFSTSPFSRLAWQESEDGGFSFAEMFHRTNYLLLVGGVSSPEGFSDCSAVLWDHAKRERLWEITLPSPIVGVCCSMGTIVIALEQRVAIYSVSRDFSSVVFERTVETVYNPLGICAVSSHGGEHSSVACPGPREGSIRVLISRGELAKRVAPGRAGRGERLVEKAHQKALSCLALNSDGSFLASASQRGTIVRLWATSQTDNPTLLRELRRGTLDADISHLAFSLSSQQLCCSSDAGTIHVFSLEPSEGGGGGGGIAASMLARIQAGQRGFARYDLGVRDPSILCGMAGDRLYAISSQGGVHEVSIDSDVPAEQRCALEACNVLSLGGGEEWAVDSSSEGEGDADWSFSDEDG